MAREAMGAGSHALFALGYSEPTSETPIIQLSEHDADSGLVTVAEEVPVALVFNGRPYVVVMATPLDLEDLAVGFSLTESIVENPGGIEHIEVVKASHGVELQVQIAAADAERLEERSRALVARTSCGLCGIERIKDVLRVPDKLPHTLDISRDALYLAGHELSKRQTLNNQTSTIHAAAWSNAFGELLIVREDVGRHNALDKVLGAMARRGVGAQGGFIVVTSRASYEMVQKAALRGVELIAAISRPTGLAIRFAIDAGVTLVGLLRGTSANVYTHYARIT
jgi:FdhD protein